ncbi:MAG: TetR/AcrR family transcriptional regulator, partial [Eubacterium sp.]
MGKKETSTKEQAQRMQQQIQQAALDLFSRYGFDHVSMADIAKAAGCSTGNIYHYFPNKEALTTHMTTYVDECYAEYEQEYLADSSHTWREKLLDFMVKSLLDSVSDQVLYS